MSHSVLSSFLRASSVATLAFVAACVCGPKVETPAAPAPVQRAEPPKGACPKGPYQQDGMTVVTSAWPTGNEASSVLCLMKMAPAAVTAGESFDYVIKVTNLTNDTIMNVTVTDRLPAGFSVSSATPPGSGGATSTWTFDKIAGHETKTITIKGVAKADGKLTNCADVVVGPIPVCVDTMVSTPKLQITKEGPAEVSACDTINYKVTVKNAGTGTAKGVVVTDKLPDGLTGGDASGTYNVGDLAGGQSKDIMISARPTKTGSFSNSASVTSANGGSSTSNAVTTKVVKPALSLSVSCPGFILGTSNITYKVTATNKGDAMCKDTRLEASIPAGTTFVSATNGGAANGASVVWTMPTLAAGQSANVEFVVHANDLGAKTTNVNVICVCADKATASCTTEVRGIPAILLEVVDENDPIRVGENEIYTITVTNQGTLKDTNVKLVVTLEDAQGYVSDSGPTKGTAAGQVITFAPLPSIDPKARAEWKLVVKALKASDIRIKVSMTSDQLTRPVEETESTNQYE